MSPESSKITEFLIMKRATAFWALVKSDGVDIETYN